MTLKRLSVDNAWSLGETAINPERTELAPSPCRLIEHYDVELVDHSKRDTERTPQVPFSPLLVGSWLGLLMALINGWDSNTAAS